MISKYFAGRLLLSAAVLLALFNSEAYAAKVWYGPGSTGARRPAGAPSAGGLRKPAAQMPGETALRYLDRLIKAGLTPSGKSIYRPEGLAEIRFTIIQAMNSVVGGVGTVGPVTENIGYYAGLPFSTVVGYGPDRRTYLSQLVIQGNTNSYALVRLGSSNIVASGRVHVVLVNLRTSQLHVDGGIVLELQRDNNHRVVAWRRLR